MNEIARVPNALSRVQKPALSQTMRVALLSGQPRRYASRDPDEPAMVVEGKPAPVTPILTNEARAVRTAYEALEQPSPPSLIENWLLDLNASVAKPLDQAMLYLRLDQVVSEFGSMPSAVWSEATISTARRKFQWFPSIAELAPILDEAADMYRSEVAHLRRFAAGPDTHRPASELDYTPEDRATIADRFRANVARVRAEQPEEQRAKPTATPSHARTDQLVAMYRALVAQGGPTADAARERLRMLEGGA